MPPSAQGRARQRYAEWWRHALGTPVRVVSQVHDAVEVGRIEDSRRDGMAQTFALLYGDPGDLTEASMYVPGATSGTINLTDVRIGRAFDGTYDVTAETSRTAYDMIAEDG